jgi:hypothetical protein
MTVEFMAVTLILVAYLAVVFSLFSAARGSLERAVDAKLQDRAERWLGFIAGRPEGTEVRLELEPFRGRHLAIKCGDTTLLSTLTGTLALGVASDCAPINVTRETCVSLTSTEGGVTIEVC